MPPSSVALVEYIGTFFTDYDPFTTAAVLAILPVLVLYVFLRRQIVEGGATQGLEGSPRAPSASECDPHLLDQAGRWPGSASHGIGRSRRGRTDHGDDDRRSQCR